MERIRVSVWKILLVEDRVKLFLGLLSWESDVRKVGEVIGLRVL